MARKTMRRIVALAITLILVAAGACAALFFLGSNSPLESARAGAINTLLEQTQLKQRLEDELYMRADRFAEDTGVPVEIVNALIETLDVTHWEATTLPQGVSQTSKIDTEVAGQQLSITSYGDPSYVTLGAYGQEVTFDVPESAETLSAALPYVSKAEDLGVIDFVNSIVQSQ